MLLLVSHISHELAKLIISNVSMYHSIHIMQILSTTTSSSVPKILTRIFFASVLKFNNIRILIYALFMEVGPPLFFQQKYSGGLQQRNEERQK